MSILAADGTALEGKALRAFWDARQDEVRTLLLDFCADQDRLLDAIGRVHADTMAPVWSANYTPDPFNESPPVRPTTPTYPAGPTRNVLPDLGVLASLSASKRADHAAAQADLDQRHALAMQQWQQQKTSIDRQHAQSVSDWQQQLSAFETKRIAHDREQAWIGKNLRSLLSNNAGFTEKALEEVIRAVDWPLDTIISYDVHHDCSAVDFDLDLPEIEDFPDYRYQLSKDERRLLKKAASESEAAKLYERYAHGAVLRLAGIAFATLPDLRAVTISGYTHRQDPATGQTNDDYVISARITRSEFSTLNFHAMGTVDPVQALRSFGARSQTRNKRMQTIDPYPSGAPA